MTAQVHEKLIYEGQETSMSYCPPLSENHPRILRLGMDELEMEEIPGIVFSTACWRRYIGTWEIRDGQFFLVALTGQYRLNGSQPLLADWFSGVLRVPRGEMLQYVHMGFASIFEQELHLEIDKGRVVNSRLIDNRGTES